MQYAIGYAPIKLRAAIIPLTQFGSMAAMPLLILGLILNTSTLVTIGIAAFGLSTLFQLVTLPVELDASRRALQTIQQNGLLTADEYPMAKKDAHSGGADLCCRAGDLAGTAAASGADFWRKRPQ